ncbi:MAG TPA: sialidase family protein [Candidatus Thermoplasmatota archaeon]|nr:sialidase family protein [Candidatus Thermoplasmatota archaeon]
MRALLLALLLVTAAVAAGCVTSEEAPATPADTATPGNLTNVTRVVTIVDPAGGLGEPSLGVTPSGVLFTNGGSAADPMIVYRSRDNGTTWENIGFAPELIPNLDPDLAVDVDGTVWANVLYVGCNAVAVSRDEGETWTMNPAVCNGPVGDRQYVIPTKGGTAYLYYHQLPTFYQTGMKTTDYGLTWVPTGPMEFPDHHLLVNGGSGWGGGGFWNPVTDSVFATYTWNTAGVVDVLLGGDGGVRVPAFSVTRNGGLTWEVGLVTTEPWGNALGLGLVVGAADDAGNVYVAWGENLEDETRIFMAASKDDGKTWNAPVRVDDGTNGSRVFPAIAAGADGKVAIAYYETATPGHPYEVGEEAVWNVTLAWTANATDEAPVFERATLSKAPARVGAICPNGAGCDSDREFLDYFALKRIPDGRVGAVWTSTEDVKGKTVNVYGASDLAVLA